MARLTLVVLFASLLCAQLNAFAGDRSNIVAVFDMEDRGSTLESKVLINLTDYLSVLLAEGGYQVVPRSQIRQRLAQQKSNSTKECFDQSCQVEMGRELAAQKSLSSQIFKIGGVCRVTATLYDLRRAATELAASAKSSCNEKELLGAVEEIARKLTIASRGGQTATKVRKAEPLKAPVPQTQKPQEQKVARAEPKQVRAKGDAELIATGERKTPRTWDVGVKIAGLMPGFGDSWGIYCAIDDGRIIRPTDEDTFKPGFGFLLDGEASWLPLSFLSVGAYGTFFYSTADDVGSRLNGSVGYLSTGLRVKGRFDVSDKIAIRPAVSIGLGYFTNSEPFDMSDGIRDVGADIQTLDGAMGLSVGASVGLAYLISHNLSLVMDVGMLTQPVGSFESDVPNPSQFGPDRIIVPFTVTFPPLFYVALGAEFGG